MSIKRNTAYNVAGSVIPLLATLVTLPIYLRTIGEERYGVLVILWTLLGYFGLFDLGLGRAVTNRIAALDARSGREREEVFWTAFLLNLGLGVVGSLLLWRAGTVVFTRFVDLSDTLSSEVYSALPWMALALPLVLTAGVMSGALTGREEFLAQNVIRVGTGLLLQVVPLVVAVAVGPALTGLVIAVVVVRALTFVAALGTCMWRLRVGLTPRMRTRHIRPLFTFGGWVTVTSVIGPLLTTLDRVLIGAIAGARAVTYYSVPFSLAARISVIPGSLSNALFPRFSSLAEPERHALLRKAVESLVLIVTPLAVLGLLIMEPFLAIWVDAAFSAQAAPVGEILVIGLWANSLAYLPFARIQGMGRPDVTAKLHSAELLPYLVILWVGLHWWGAVGAAIAWTVRVWVDAILMFFLARFAQPRTLALPALAMLGGGLTVVCTSGLSWTGLGVRVAVAMVVAAWAWWSAPATFRGLIGDLLSGFRLVPGSQHE